MIGEKLLKRLKRYTGNLWQASGNLSVADESVCAPILFAKKKKHKTARKAATSAGVKPRKARRKLPVPEQKKTGVGTQRAEKFFTKLNNRYAAAGYGSTDYARMGILAAGLMVVLYYAFQAGGYFIAQRSYGGLWVLYLVILGLLFSLQLKGRMPRLGRV